MIMERGIESVTLPCAEWIDENGKKWGNPQLAFMIKRGFAMVQPTPFEPTQEEIFAQAQAELTNTIQQHLDTVAQSRNYDGILSLCTYVASTDPIFAAEGQAGVVWRDACWRKGYEVMTAVIAGTWRTRTPEEIAAAFFPIPTAEELLAEMPVIGWQ